MGHVELMPPNDLVVGDLLPLRGTTEMLGLQGPCRRAPAWRRSCRELFGRHSRPQLVEEGAVVNADGRSNDFGETVPILELRVRKRL